MKLSNEIVYYLHEKGLMPDWVWIQQNGKTARENYEYQKKKMRSKSEQQEQEEIINDGIEKSLQAIFGKWL